MRSSERGFSLLEVLVAAGLFVVSRSPAFEALRQLLAGSRQLAARQLALGGLERLTAQMRAEARSATAIWVGASAGGGHDDCTQLDFLGTDASGPKFWSYRRFPNHTRSPQPGATPAPSDDAVPGDALQRVAGTAPLAACASARSGRDGAAAGSRASRCNGSTRRGWRRTPTRTRPSRTRRSSSRARPCRPTRRCRSG